MLVACRNKQSSYDATLTYLFTEEGVTRNDSVRFDGITLQESTELVDGIGGTTWEGSLVLSKLLESALAGESQATCPSKLHLIELGCGTGLCGIVTHHKLSNSRVSLTDRHCDLALLNIQNHLVLKSMLIPNNVVNRFRNLKRKSSSDSSVNHLRSMNLANERSSIIAVDMPWESGKSNDSAEGKSSDSEGLTHSPTSLITMRGLADVIVGAEITCLIKQQQLLVSTVAALCERNPLTVVLMSFDGPPPKTDQESSKYERQFNELMKTHKFIGSVVYTASVSWTGDSSGTKSEQKDNNSTTLYAYMRDETLKYKNDLLSLSLPVEHDTALSYKPLPSEEKSETRAGYPPAPPLSVDDAELLKNTTTHHIIAYYRPAAVNTCSRCHHQFFRTPALNPITACRHHTGYFVCRWHPAEVRLSVGHGDSLGYYGTGTEGYAAKFWDCCGSEDPSHPGCQYDRHIAY